ncbi:MULTISPECIES: phage antirepressor N-terminal domain-containing protein [Symbiopectobacterium]|uniref:phage antirepressor N-terminal domain-containing protein n=1 Tax=Candidatus Symbiopectobacterium sp. PLON1 TaxID=2794575 RepID=UPI00207AB253|nr:MULTISPECIES: phage antirepressor N-terminal domain-containing protein [Symbiopectobacterium]
MQYPVSNEVEFYGDKLTTVREGGIEYVALRPIVEAIGLDWASQTVKLNKNREKYECCDIATPSKGGIQSMLCLPLKKLNGWLFSINPEKVKASIRGKLIAYQEECFAVLHDYWKKGLVVNPRKVSVMEELNQACADIKRDKGIASLFGTGLNEWKSVKAAHVKKIQ